MALPTYDKTKRRKSFEHLPKGAYVIQIKQAKEVENKNGNGSHIAIVFDIAEGEYKDFYRKQYEKNDSEDKKWPNDAVFRLTVPKDDSQPWIWNNWNSFFADLEDSNNGYVFNGETKALKGKLIGGKFHIEQNEFNGRVYNHTRLRWTCVAEDVRAGKAGQMPADKLISGAAASRIQTDNDGFMNIPAGEEEEIPFI